MKAKPRDKTKAEKTLYISRETGKPEKMEIKDTNQKTVIYILYTEVTVNS